MNWLECSNRMDRFVIKTDGTAVDMEYFMATHVPFRKLEFLDYGDTEANATYLSEEQIYEEYIVNKADRHQMLIVRGTNGTGKSHLICWLHNRFVGDHVNYNPEKEKVIFLRRLGNTVKGAVRQILDEGIVQDQELQEKFQRFTSAEQSQSEDEMKATIYNEYARRVATDTSGKVFSPINCKDISAFLHDKRVEEYMMRSGGPVDRCYQMITAGAKTIVTDNTDAIFTKDDFDFPKEVNRKIKREAAEEVRAFYLDDLNEDHEDAKKKTKLADYLNGFTSGVIQNCANITSESARDLFVNLRRSLYKEGKKLTIFIEDFTSFSIVESELITALSVENGGNYSDLCRVTSVIGITDGYYGSFRDNFKDRVTKQIRVNEQSFGSEDFLLEMAARYLNAIYSPEASVKTWFHENAISTTQPKAEFVPEFSWDSVKIGETDYTLYPFNKKSLIALYDGLKTKTPRYFLNYVIREFFFDFANDMEYRDDWRFPVVSSFIETDTLQPPYANSVESTAYSDEDKQRLKVIFSVWGDGTTEATKEQIGGINRQFLAEIGFADFKGIESGGAEGSESKNPPQGGQQTTGQDKQPVQPKLSKKEQDFNRRQKDIESWYEKKETLQYASDYNKWVGAFVLQGIAWQDEGYPANFVTERNKNGNFVDIEDSKVDTSRDRAVVVLERTSEARTVLMGLLLFDYYKNWEFENAPYYQLFLINWLEKNKQTFIDNIFGDTVGAEEHPVIIWCLATEYLQRLLYGEKLNTSSDEKLLIHLLTTQPKKPSGERINSDWNDVIKFMENKSSKKTTLNNYLVSGSNTVMGVVGAGNTSGDVPFYRTRELINGLEHLKSKNWDISDELAACTSLQYESVRKYLADIYSRIHAVVNSERKLAKVSLKEFEKLVGKTVTEDEYVKIVNEIHAFFFNCDTAHEHYSTDLKMKFDGEPIEQAKSVIVAYETMKQRLSSQDEIDLLSFFAERPVEAMNDTIKNLQLVEKKAVTLKEKHRTIAGGGETIDPLLMQAVLEKLEELSDRISEMGVAL